MTFLKLMIVERTPHVKPCGVARAVLFAWGTECCVCNTLNQVGLCSSLKDLDGMTDVSHLNHLSNMVCPQTQTLQGYLAHEKQPPP